MLEMNSASHDALLTCLEATIEIAQNCCIPPLTQEEFIELSQVIWEETQGKYVPQFIQKEFEEKGVAD